MDKRRARPLVSFLLVLAGCATGGHAGGGESGGGGNQVGAPVPEIRMESLGGKALGVSDYRGKVLLLDVWASWCGPCKQELPMLDDMAKRLRGDGITILAVSIDQERANLVKFLRVRPHWALTIAHDPKGEIADRLSPEKMPTSYIIDRAGIIRYVNSGFVPGDATTIERRLVEVAGH
jgi:cytochrome c biogenesis protein CcmG, thiol:disulfide interchange protein DsbE